MSNSRACQAIVYNLIVFRYETAMYTDFSTQVALRFMAHTHSVGEYLYTRD